MSAQSSSPPVASSEGPGLSVRIAAVLVVLALAALAAYTVFSGPTRVSVGGPQTAAPINSAPPASQQEPEGEGGRGD